MSKSHMKVYIHGVFSTKDRIALIQPSIKQKVYRILEKELEETGCQLLAINGMPNHVHLLFILTTQLSIADVMKRIKGASSHRINQGDFIEGKFAWQVGYGAFSVSQSGVKNVKDYIDNQEVFHEKITFDTEFKKLMALHGLGRNG